VFIQTFDLSFYRAYFFITAKKATLKDCNPNISMLDATKLWWSYFYNQFAEQTLKRREYRKGYNRLLATV
jgi:hypothetical protein